MSGHVAPKIMYYSVFMALMVLTKLKWNNWTSPSLSAALGLVAA